MLPNLTLMIAVYVCFRYVTIAIKQYRGVADNMLIKAAVATVAIVGVIVTTVVVVDTFTIATRVGDRPAGMRVP